ncbi:extracellular solute-binding protein [candidate division KSB3 bacterium]|uniref:Extracellular solute-binding protein n=1 Tax=candidate division KSB3 bacterium TaxID=2044937 RepID=A0A9D5JUE2_9BACT|nr:extracellular solute-binding protein [candidate division KSB3 bacterium]MBD3324437.1 extracellular solute-binding protein [candidate division KSB3 bacterium]
MKRTLGQSVILCVVLIGIMALPVMADEWTDMVKVRYGGTTITCAFAPHPTTDAFQAMVDEFTELTGIDVRWDIIEEGYLRQKLLLEHEAQTGVYDVLLIDAFNMAEYSPSGVAADLEPFINNADLTPDWFDYEDILPAYRDGIGKYDGVIYGIPVAGETRYVGYRKDLFEKYDKEPPETMAELLELAKFFKGKEEGLYGIGMRGQKGIHFASGWMTTMYQNGGQYLDQTTWEVLVNSPDTIASLEYYVDLLNQGPPDIGVYTHEEAVSIFMSGKSALWFDSTALTSWILDETKSVVVDKVGFVPPPEGKAGAYGALAGWNVGISSDVSQERQEAAWAFIVWMTSKKNAKQYVKLGGTPVRQSVYSDPELVAENWTFPIQLEALARAANLVNDGITWIPPHVKTMKVLEVVGDYGSEVLAGQMTAQEAMDKAQVEVEAIMAE